MNGSDACDSLITKVNWTDAVSLAVLAVLLLINVMVVVGNCLVIAAVYISSKLRTVTNLFIVSLAVADLMVGVAVLPFSATWEVFKVWIFGDLWCSVWLAVDVWMCTASILNLCAISLDRYVAVTRPVNYPSIMSSSRAKVLIAGVWILSFVICFPPLVGWKDSGLGEDSLDSSAAFRMRHPHPMVVNQRPSATSPPEASRLPTTATATATASGPATVTAIASEPPKNVTELLRTDYGDYEEEKEEEEEEGEGEEAAGTGEYPEYPQYEEYSWTNSRRRARRSVGGDLLKRLASFSGVPVVAVNHFHYPGQENLPTEASGLASTTPPPPSEALRCPWICELTSDTGYVIYSALGSFFIPMGVMLFFYWRIYRAAVQTTRAINQGFRTTKGSGGFGNRFEEQRLTLRIHRGRGSVQNHSSASSSVTTCGSPSANSTYGKSPEVQRLSRTRSMRSAKSHEKIKISVSYPSSDHISSSVLNNNGVPPPGPPTPPGSSPRSPKEPLVEGAADGKDYLSIGTSVLTSPKKTIFLASPPKKHFFQNRFSSKKYSAPEVGYSVRYSNRNGRETTTTNLHEGREPECYLRVTGARLASSSKNERSLSVDSTASGHEEESSSSRRNSTRSQAAGEEGPPGRDLSPGAPFDKPRHLVSKMGKRNIKTQVKRFRMETKAAKTLGIIVGGFVLCWMPFFTIYLVRAFCLDCVNPVVFSVLFWLGYCNSAINPCIYALFSKDFRFAFKKIICRFLCGPEKRLSVNLKRRGSDGSQARTPGRQRSPSCNPPNSVGEDSDPGGSDSR